jgi:hypothetical protein
MRDTALLVLAQGGTGSEPAGGAAAAEAIGATAGALVATTLMLLLVAGHRSGRVHLLERLGALSERATGLPAWAALPGGVLGASLLTAVLGMYWDISLHIDNGRDAGPLANPAHYLILVGLFGALFAGVLAIALPRERPGPGAVRIAPAWYAPLGGVLIAACGAFALSGFPLDDLWHRLFGQDVTLWGPTHLMLIGGASLATLGAMLLTSEGMRARAGRVPGEHPRLLDVRRVLLAGGFLVGLSTFQGEFDFGVPQFRLVLQPILIMLAAGVGLVAARIYLGRGGALYAVAGFILIRGLVTLMVGPVFGQTTPHFPLYLAEAALVELVALRLGTRSPLRLGAVAGVAVGTLGLGAEWGWSHVWMPIPWPAALLPEAAILGIAAAVAGGVLGGFVGRALTGARPAPAAPRTRLAVPAAALAVVGVLAYAVPVSADRRVDGEVSLRELASGPERSVTATVRLDPPDAGDDAEWLEVTAWQGGGRVVAPLERIGPGTYRSTKPIPVHPSWKALIRLHRGDSLLGLPIFLPEDRAIPAPELPAEERFTRSFELDREILQRERRDGVSGWLTVAGYLTVLAIALLLLALLAWLLLRFERGGARRQAQETAVGVGGTAR